MILRDSRSQVVLDDEVSPQTELMTRMPRIARRVTILASRRWFLDCDFLRLSEVGGMIPDRPLGDADHSLNPFVFLACSPSD